ncbi:hypothetical protein P154DRAFT_581013 [Amniculicola lignicola CBS 123094]|uniref:Ubiquitin 3 binding protein But2 C-terminal domain-containing protein n=1 Tax=Amniculicola lignicola CBS 123094 TaxID=1392246 RepID=A0A6A5W2U8_9PLEO|nr:hypothetical protein P154DRAFT_581013 [Amniculicola lignicola CBS 123094]
MHAVTLALTTFLALTTAVPNPFKEIRPTVLSHYSVWSGAIDYNKPNGRVFKDGRTSDITTLVKFVIPSAAAGKPCQFKFPLGTADTVTGSRKVDVFKSLGYPTGSTTGWPPGNRRDVQLARLVFDANKVASYEDIRTIESFTCPPAGEWPVEIVGVYDNVEVKWTGGSSGPVLLYKY